MSVLPPFELHRPDTLDEVLERVSWDDLPFVGGTELLLAMKAGLLNPRSLIDLKRVEELGRIEVGGDGVTIGAAVSHQSVIDHDGVRAGIPELGRVLRRVGNPRVRAAGTLAGNLCFAEPKSDVIPFLVGAGAELTLASASGSRTMPVSEFVLGPYFTARDEHELLTAIRIPLVDGRRASYAKYQIMERPTVGVAAFRWGTGAETTTRVVVGAAGELPAVHEETGEGLDPDEVARTLSAAIEPVDDLTGSVEYKRHVTGVFVKRALAGLEVS
jgi:carbon-monoxide dehydrogenase medium subunit